jgi:hypothetical protein
VLNAGHQVLVKIYMHLIKDQSDYFKREALHIIAKLAYSNYTFAVHP